MSHKEDESLTWWIQNKVSPEADHSYTGFIAADVKQIHQVLRELELLPEVLKQDTSAGI